MAACAAEIQPSGTPAAKPPITPVPDSTATTESEMKSYTESFDNGEVKFDMVPIPGGTFTMGSPDDEEGREAHEGPQHEVKIEPFWMGKCEVTWDEYDVFMSALDIFRRKQLELPSTENDRLADAIAHPTVPYGDPTYNMGKYGGYPAVNMTHFAARMYCKWLTAKTGRYYRLPTEAEWEYACRAGSNTAYSFGDSADTIDEYAWHYDNSNEKYQKVGKKKPNAWKLHDMHGNVAEWTLDQFSPDFYKQCKDGSAAALLLPKEKDGHSVRGGSWNDPPEDLRSAARIKSDLEEWQQQDPQSPTSVWGMTDGNWVGFRVVRPLHEPSEQEIKEKWDVGLDKESEDGDFFYPLDPNSTQKSKKRFD